MYKQLNSEQRYTIFILLQNGMNKKQIKTITTDNGLEFASHEKITKSIGAPVYFADSYSSWPKGAIENINGLIRKYIPKSTTFERISQQ